MSRDKVQSEAIVEANKHFRSGLAISMGVGKTLIGLTHMASHYNTNARFLVVAPKVSIFQSWKDDAVKFKMQYLLDRIDFTTYLSLSKRDPSKYNVVYLDECHSLLYSHKDFLDAYKGKILGLTGTPPVRQFTEKAKMVNQYCPIVFRYQVDEAVNANILNDYRIIVHMLSLSEVKDFKVNMKNGKSFKTSEKERYAYTSSRIMNSLQGTQEYQFAVISRMTALKQFNTKEKYVKTLLNELEGNKTIVFCNTQVQADRVCKHSYHSGNYKSEANLKLFKESEVDTLSCVDQLNEGVTIPNLDTGIIMHAYGNERKTNQRIGRLLRLNPDMVSNIHILCYRDTVDTKWVQEALKTIDPNKITYLER
jgi:superfamily II DNA or RNA helicase